MNLIICFTLMVLNISTDDGILSMAREKLGKYKVTNNRYVVIIDYSKSIDEERLYLVDINKNKIILKSTVSHGVNSGGKYGTKFSNIDGSLQSSLGGYKTGIIYNGKYGRSLVLDGLDDGINSNARSRYIVFHSNKKMRTKWSWGCFATPDNINDKLINIIKDGCLVYVHN